MTFGVAPIDSGFDSALEKVFINFWNAFGSGLDAIPNDRPVNYLL